MTVQLRVLNVGSVTSTILKINKNSQAHMIASLGVFVLNNESWHRAIFA
ncbi:MAG: hypothetical protein HWQ44_09215 [Nostoc sp. JL34]|nr:hypothetical protein [Nostoc sp. JL34]